MYTFVYRVRLYYIFSIVVVLLVQCGVGDDAVGGENDIAQQKTQKPEIKADVSDESKAKPMTPSTLTPPSPENMYQRLLRQKRISHMEAVKTIVGLEDYQKEHKMITLLLDKLFKVLTDAQVKLMSMGFSPDDKFPENETVRDAYSQVIENTAFFGDLVLRLPDIVHDVMKKKKDWSLLIQWGVGFCNMAEIFESKDKRMLNLMSQELGIIEQEPSYVNPYKQENLKASMLAKESLEEYAKEVLKKQRKKRQKERKKGPRLSGGHSEL